MNLFRVCSILGLCFAVLSSGSAQVIQSDLVRLFNNPTPESQIERFGRAVLALDEERVIVGAPQDSLTGGAAYMFAANGSVIATFTNPGPATMAYFGDSLAALSMNQILIAAPRADAGAVDAGAIHVFSTNNVLLTTITNPTPESYDFFGGAVAALDPERIIIGATGDGSVSHAKLGAVYLYSTNGMLITTITNPNPLSFAEDFGAAVCGVGADAILVGARATKVGGVDAVGIAYLFNTNGALITTFTNPTPAEYDSFGITVAPLGSDRVLIAAHDNDAAGSVYLFNTNGMLLRTLVGPDPARREYFGSALTFVGPDLIVVGAPQDKPWPPTFDGTIGAAHIFSTNASLLATIATPSPRSDENFGNSITAIGTNKVLIGATTAYLFRLSFLPPPALATERLNAGSVRIKWPYPSTGFLLERSGSLDPLSGSNVWNVIPPPYASSYFSNGVPVSVRNVVLSPPTNQFFRLRQP
jgi:hypothetical protein